MKFLTTNFVKCAIKTCDSSLDAFPLQYTECQLVQEESDFNPEFICHMLERLDWQAILRVAADLGNTSLPATKPEDIDPIMEDDQALLRDLHTLLVETQIVEGKMTCRNCDHIYYIKNSIPNFLLPPHLC
ncbi:multifunctional methyltransferase subunit Trm112p [[Candida] anglica]|uniref:Multifunctional methyltransferase subunit Trm112p n=1 Tax=[Candida] anglica TaxID=148631 RepID=A0ABP0ECF3_9ASCO